PLMSGSEALQVDTAKMLATLTLTQLAPLCAGLALRRWGTRLASQLERPVRLVSTALRMLTVAAILVAPFPTLLEIRPRGFLGMLALLVVSLAAGWLLGGPGVDQ